MVLIDTSVWIEVFRKPSRFDLASFIELDEIVTCLPVIQEVLLGFREERAFCTARDAMTSFPCVESPLTASIFEEAVHLFRTARRAGRTIRSGVDCLIAACSIRQNLTLLHCDRDFGVLAEVSSLQARRALP